MLAHLPLGTQPLSTLGAAATASDDTFVVGCFDDDALLAAPTGEDKFLIISSESPLEGLPIVVVDETIVVGTFDEFELIGTEPEQAFITWSGSPLDDEEGSPPAPPQPGPLSALGGAGWFADVPASRRRRPKPTWPSLPPPSFDAPRTWRLTTVTRDTARLRAHRAVKAMRAKLKRETNLEEHVIAGILAALIADQDKDD